MRWGEMKEEGRRGWILRIWGGGRRRRSEVKMVERWEMGGEMKKGAGIEDQKQEGESLNLMKPASQRTPRWPDPIVGLSSLKPM